MSRAHESADICARVNAVPLLTARQSNDRHAAHICCHIHRDSPVERLTGVALAFTSTQAVPLTCLLDTLIGHSATPIGDISDGPSDTASRK